MELNGLDYNTERDKLRLMAYGREIQQMVDHTVSLPTKAERQEAAETIIETMKRVVQSQQSYKERTPMLWYHLALLSDFKLDIDYPVEFDNNNRMQASPDHIDYFNKEQLPTRHYGRHIYDLLNKLKTMPEGSERDMLANITAEHMCKTLETWSNNNVDKERIISDIAKYTDGVIQLNVNDIVSNTIKITKSKSN